MHISLYGKIQQHTVQWFFILTVPFYERTFSGKLFASFWVNLH